MSPLPRNHSDRARSTALYQLFDELVALRLRYADTVPPRTDLTRCGEAEILAMRAMLDTAIDGLTDILGNDRWSLIEGDQDTPDTTSS
jgi:hypothetical protein